MSLAIKTRKKLNAYNRWMGRLLKPSSTHMAHFHRWVRPRFLRLFTPISTHVPLQCALSMSFLVGALRHCIE